MLPLCKRCRRRGAHRSPMLSSRDCAKRQARDEDWDGSRLPRQVPRQSAGQRQPRQDGDRAKWLRPSPFPAEECEVEDAGIPPLVEREAILAAKPSASCPANRKSRSDGRTPMRPPPSDRRRGPSRRRAPIPLASSISRRAGVGRQVPCPDSARLRRACPEESREPGSSRSSETSRPTPLPAQLSASTASKTQRYRFRIAQRTQSRCRAREHERRESPLVSKL